MAGRYPNNRGYLPAYLPVCLPAHLTSVSRHFAVAWQPCCRSVAILLLWRGNLVVVAWQSCCCSVAIFRGCSGLRCTNIASDKNLPRNTQNPQNLLADKSLPQIAQIFTEASGGGYSPTDFTDVHRFFFSASRFCVFREFCGKIVCWLRGYGRDAIPTQPSEFLPQNPFQVCLRKSSHRTHRIHRSFRRRIFSHRLHRFSQK